ncbi:MAG: 16S rRNA (guanine(966)-N(2))-methyltransferase RsmD [Acidobacteria bacterium]|jgi:16S rRNA (guanine966-N2)-methyltransferase|nr:16S rRNA (guanine(966)-N(2))-methyltransferase RsmD [Bryobacteraceae bacterium CoA2 C42]MCA2966493.1 16S rRNA (guanine(966)-N(2))-methyltransferase RsmD [Acidobacteriaceae bacterium]
MRVIAGEFRSRRLQSVEGTEVRPTPDRLRESLFNILQTRLAGMVFVDAYAGTGAVGLEALSRGARRVLFIERNKEALRVLFENIQSLGVQGRTAIIKRKASEALRTIEADIVFLDPPFTVPKEFDAALTAVAETAVALVIVQHPPRQVLADEYGPLRRSRIVKQGDNWLSFYER